MGRMKDHFIEMKNLEMEFLYFLEQLFSRMNYRILSLQRELIPGPQADLVVMPPDEEGLIAIELKLHRSARVPLALLRNAFDQLDRLVEVTNATRGILIITQPLKELDSVRAIRGIHELWDLQVLTAKVLDFPDLATDLVDLVRAAQVGTLAAPPVSAAMAMLADEVPEMPEIGAGARLAAEIEASAVGRRKKAAQRFEELCQQALELLYRDDFADWKKQAPIEKGYQRLDLVARLVPVQGSFWAILATDFRTRYVIFEFKNYGKPITQNEIYTTEKYLFTTALRSVAIIIARKGDNESARRAMRGALREQGKLILCISMADLCGLLRGWDNGDDPTGLLVERLDEILTTIAR